MIDFAAPLALVALIALLPVAAALVHQQHRDANARRALGGSDPLRRGRSETRRRIRTVLMLAALALTAVAVARPQWGTSDQPVIRRGIDVAIALDVSRSMTAPDVEPTRAIVAARGLGALLDHLRGDRVGLVSFAGGAFVRSPLTLDLEAVRQLIDQAQSETLLVRPGTDLSEALRQSIRLLDVDDAAATQVIVLVSDGEGQSAARLDDALDLMRRNDVRVYTVAAGTEQGIDIPADRLGGTERTAVDRATLERIADVTGGEFRDTGTVAGLAVEFARLRQSQFAESMRAAPVERFQWFLGGALLLLVAQTLVAEGARVRPLRATRVALGATALLAAVILACGGSDAYRHVRDGNAAYEQGNYDRALTAYRQAAELLPDDPTIAYDTGNALHRLRRFEEATAASAAAAFTAETRDLRQRATYALGSHAYRRDALEEARDAFTAVLRLDPDDDDARHNLELVLLALAPPPPPEAAEQGDTGPAGDDDQEGEQQDGADGQGGEPGSSPATSADTTASDDAGGEGAGQSAPSDAREPGQGEPSDEARLTSAQQALAEALVGFGTEVSIEQALAILDLVREVNTLTARMGSGLPSGRLPAR